MKVWIVEWLWGKEWQPCGGFFFGRKHAMNSLKEYRSREPEIEHRVRPYLRVEPAPRKKARSGKGKRRG